MIATAKRVARMLRDERGVDEWVLRDSEIRRVVRVLGGGAARSEFDEVSLRALVLSDGESGRGAATLDVVDVDVDDAGAAALVARAAADAAAGRGPPWVLPPSAAPAHVELSDRRIAADPGNAVGEIVSQLDAVSGRALILPGARVTAEVHRIGVETSRGFASEYRMTSIEVDVWLASQEGGGRARERVWIRERRMEDGTILAALATAAERLARRARAVPLAPGPVDLLLEPPALAAGDWGWFAPFVANADARRVRLGVSRYRPGQPVFGAGGGGEHISLVSDGTVAFAPRSAPFGDLGEPVRRFELIRAGAASGLALDLREAALAGTTANGGVRNLELAAGRSAASDLQSPGERPLLTVHDLAWIDVDDRSGDMAAGISLASRQSGATSEAVTGGILVGNLFDMWSRAQLSVDAGGFAWYRGPAAVRIDSVLVQ